MNNYIPRNTIRRETHLTISQAQNESKRILRLWKSLSILSNVCFILKSFLVISYRFGKNVITNLKD